MFHIMTGLNIRRDVGNRPDIRLGRDALLRVYADTKDPVFHRVFINVHTPLANELYFYVPAIIIRGDDEHNQYEAKG